MFKGKNGKKWQGCIYEINVLYKILNKFRELGGGRGRSRVG